MGAREKIIIPRLRKRDQQPIARHGARFKVVVCGRRWGKTTLGMAMAINRALMRGERVWWVAPTYLMARHPWETFKRRLGLDWDAKLENDHHIDLPNGGSITVKTAENADGLRGVGIDFVVVDEAAFIDEYVWNHCLRPALADREGKALIISTPRGRNWFHSVFQHGQDPEIKDWQSWHYPTQANPIIKPQEIEDSRALMPERIFQQEFEAKFLEDGGSVFRRIHQAAIAPYGAVPLPGHEYVMGIDFARYVDFTALVVIDRTDRVMVALDRFSEVNWGLQRQRIAALARKWNCTDVLAESNAMGEPNIEALWRQDGIPVRAFQTTARSKPPLIESLVAAIENVDLTLLPDPVLLGELESYSYHNARDGHTVYAAPEGRHDDTVIALALAWKAATVPRLTLAIAG